MNANSTVVIRDLLASVEEEIAAVQGRLEELKVERQGLTLALRRLPSEEPAPAPAPKLADFLRRIAAAPTMPPRPPLEQASTLAPQGGAWSHLSKVDAVRRVLAEAPAPITPTEIAERLGEVGLPQKDTTGVRGTLNHLKNKDEVRLLGRGQWVLAGGPADPGDAETPAGTGVSVDVPTTGAGGDSNAAQADRDHGDHVSGEDRDHDCGASVDEPPF